MRWLSNGELEYIGRHDFQVKIRGYRIELGEIENTLGAIEGIEQTCVLAKKTSNKYLAAYYVAKEGVSLSEDTIIAKLEAKLPNTWYPVPLLLWKASCSPLTVNSIEKHCLSLVL